ncbi:hypothetical protein HKI87_04g28140 [Chloropicon roscoffensis]|uniref:Uncharacterized protein n=1 Tax=Chloropicon roscoffensis TaxID=1461544 RepID=A0AAX4P687_9CHLO
MEKQVNGDGDTSLNVPANFRELTVFTSTRPDSPPLTGPDYKTVDGTFYKREADGTLRPVSTKDFVGKTPLERNQDLGREEAEAEAALVDAQLRETREWLRKVEEENELKLRERLNEQRKAQQEHFRKLDIRDDYLPPNLAFGSLPTGKSFRRRKAGDRPGDETDDETGDDDDPSTTEEHGEGAWAENVYGNKISGSHQYPPSASLHHPMYPSATGGPISLSPHKRPTSAKVRAKVASKVAAKIAKWFLLLVVHDLGLVLLCLWVFNQRDSNKEPWKWLGFTEDGV